MGVVVDADRRLDRRAVHGAEPARHVQEAARLVQIDVDFSVLTQPEDDALEVEQIDGVVDVEEGIDLEVAQEQVGTAR